MMQSAPPARIAFVTAIAVVLIVLASHYGIPLVLADQTGWLPATLTAIAILFLTFGLLFYVLKSYVLDRIRLIYKTIHNLKVPSGQKSIQVSSGVDLIYQTNREVIDWVEQNTKELEELQKLSAYRREFLGNVSHELRTPIFNIQGYVLTLLDGALDDPSINRQYLQRTVQSINRLISIVDDLESISRLESGELQLKIAQTNIVELAREVLEFSELNAAEKNIRLGFAKNYESPIWVDCDKERIQQVLTNLLVNSISYGKTDGETKVSFFDMDQHILVEVTDNGMGISREDLPRIFDRFFRGDKSRTSLSGAVGSGLGLTIVKHIIEAHKQTIHVSSTPALGTTFSFTLKKSKPAGFW